MKQWFEILLLTSDLVRFANKYKLVPGEILVIEHWDGKYDYQSGGTPPMVKAMYYAEKQLD